MSSANSVEEQYSHYAYPEPGDDIPTWLRSKNYDFYDPGIFSALYWPEGRPRSDLDVLVAGCGTMQAAVLAFSNPECKITGIDFSQSSIAHEERLRERHQLTNLTLQKMDLRDAPKLGRSFDLIVSSGVLHHLPDPDEGLRALTSVLEPAHGAMLLMLYGRLARTGVYALQDAFRRMRVPQTAEGIKIVRAAIQRLPPRHPARWYFDIAPELKTDAAIVDTFLHPQDAAYSVQDVLDLVERNGLKFQGWLDRGIYNQDWEGLDQNISDPDRWSVIEDFTARLTTHLFIVSSRERDRRSEVKFDDDRWPDYYPQRHPDLRPSQFDKDLCVRGDHEFKTSPLETVLIAEANGARTITEILKHKVFAKMTKEQGTTLAREFYKRMWRFGHMFFSAVPIKRRESKTAARGALNSIRRKTDIRRGRSAQSRFPLFGIMAFCSSMILSENRFPLFGIMLYREAVIRETSMRELAWLFIYSAFLLGLTGAPSAAQQPPGPAMPSVAPSASLRPPPTSTPRPYQPLAVKLPPVLDDQSFETFRNEIAVVAKGRVYAELERLVTIQGFFWDRDFQGGFDRQASAGGQSCRRRPARAAQRRGMGHACRLRRREPRQRRSPDVRESSARRASQALMRSNSIA